MADAVAEEGDFLQAIDRYTEAISLNRNNHLLFYNRSAAYARVGKFAEALEDAKRCHELKQDWPKAYYRLGVALQGLERHEEAMIVFAEGLAADPKQAPMLHGLIETMIKSPYRGNFQPKLEKFESLKLDKNPFIITSVIGQELQSANRPQSAVKVLEAARAIGTESLKLEASLLQALGRVHWLLGNTERALEYMEKDLRNNITLNDEVGCCRARDNLGIAYFSLGRYQQAILHHREQLELAKARNDRLETINSLTRLGNAFSKMENFPEAQKAYRDSLKLSKEINDQSLIARAYSNLGCLLLSSGDVDKAITWHHQHLSYAKEVRSKPEEAEAYGHLGHACYLNGNYDQSMMFYQQLLSVAVQMSDMSLKAKAYGGMGHANRAMGQLWHAQSCREQQLKLCKDMGDEDGQAIALSHLGHIHKESGKLSQAMHYYSESLSLARKLKDRAGEGRAYANLGSCHIALGNYRDAVGYYKQELAISQELGSKASEATTLGHLGAAYLALENMMLAVDHFRRSHQLAQEVGDKTAACQALSNLGHYHTCTKEYSDALPNLERALKLAQELKDRNVESKVCHDLGLCHEALGHYQQAIQYYQHDFMVAKEAQDKEGMTRACEKLIRAHSEIGDKEQAEIFKRKLHTIAEEIQNTSGKCTFWNQIAEDSLNSGDFDKAIEYYENLLKEAKKEQHQSFEGLAYCGLGNAYLSRGDYEHALSYHRRDLTIRKAATDQTGECNAYGNMGAAYNSMAQHSQAVDCYEHQLALAKQLDNPILTTKAYGCLGIVNRNMKNFQRALQYHQLQLSSALLLKENISEQASAYANLGDSYEAVGDYQQASKTHDHHLSLAQKMQNEMMQIRALSSLGRAHRGMGNLRRSLFYFEQQLKLARSIGDEYIEAECYADKGGIQMFMGEYPAALDSYSNQLKLSQSLQDAFSQALAACGLGEVHARLGNHREAIDYHKLDLRISSANRFVDGEARALGNIAEIYESIGEYKSAIEYHEKQLSAADTLQDSFIKSQAFTGLGKIYIKMNEHSRAISLLKQALSLVVDRSHSDSEQHTQTEIEAEAKIRFYLGQAFYYQCHSEGSLVYLQKALPLFEHLRQHVGHYDHSTKQTLELYPILFQTLVNTLVKLGKVEEALEMAEMERNRAISDALMHREVNQQVLKDSGLIKPYAPNSSWIQEAVDTIQSPVLYFSVALNHVFIWLLHPKSGIVQFQKVDMTDFNIPGSDTASVYSETSLAYIQPLVDTVASVRETLGVEQRYRLAAKSVSSGISDDFDSGEDNDSIGGGGSTVSAPAYRGGGAMRTETIGISHKGPPRAVNMQPIHELYDILIKPLEYALPKPRTGCGGSAGRLIIVPDKDLYLVPFGLLKGEALGECLYERYQLLFAPSLQSLIPAAGSRKSRPPSRSSSRPPSRPNSAAGNAINSSSLVGGHNLQVKGQGRRAKRAASPGGDSLGSLTDLGFKELADPLIVGNPAIPISAAQCNWQPLKGVEKETKLIADLLQVSPILGHSASKDRLMKKLSGSECIHLATNVSWNRCEVILAPPDNRAGADMDNSEGGGGAINRRGGGDGGMVARRGEADGAVNALPEPTQYLLTVSELITTPLSAKLVVISGGHRTESPRVTSKGLMCMAQALLAAGAECVLIPIWSSGFQASRLMMNAFYSSLIYGSKASRALRYAMQVVHTSGKHGHPANWAGYMLMGKDIVLRDRSADLARSLRMMLQSPQDYLIATLKTLQAMLVNSLKRIAQCDGLVEPKYTSRQAVESKVGTVHGWEEMLTYTGFHFIGPMKDVPATIVFPEHDDSGLQRKAQKHLEALLGLPSPCLKALALLTKHPEVVQPLVDALHSAKVALDSHDGFEKGIHVQLPKEIWAIAGCSDFFQNLNFALSQTDAHSPWVTLSAPAVKLERKMLHFASTSIAAACSPDKTTDVTPRKAVETSELL